MWTFGVWKGHVPEGIAQLGRRVTLRLVIAAPTVIPMANRVTASTVRISCSRPREINEVKSALAMTSSIAARRRGLSLSGMNVVLR